MWPFSGVYIKGMKINQIISIQFKSFQKCPVQMVHQGHCQNCCSAPTSSAFNHRIFQFNCPFVHFEAWQKQADILLFMNK